MQHLIIYLAFLICIIIQQTQQKNQDQASNFKNFFKQLNREVDEFQDAALEKFHYYFGGKGLLEYYLQKTPNYPKYVNSRQYPRNKQKQQKSIYTATLDNPIVVDRDDKNDFNIKQDNKNKQEQTLKQIQSFIKPTSTENIYLETPKSQYNQTHFKTLLKKFYQNTDDQNLRRQLQLNLEDQEDSDTTDEYDSQQKIRLGDRTCQNGAKQVMSQTRYFVCNDKFVSYEDFMKLVLETLNSDDSIIYDNENILWPEDGTFYDYSSLTYSYQDYDYTQADCIVYYAWQESCLCPIGYEGYYCQIQSSINCALSQQVDTQNDRETVCEFDKYNYNQNIEGDPPCSIVREEEEEIQLSLYLQCQNKQYQEQEKLYFRYSTFWTIFWNKEVKDTSDNLYLPDPTRYNYAINTTYTTYNNQNYTLIQKDIPELTIFSKFANWNRLSHFQQLNTIQISDSDSFIGEKPVNYQISMKDVDSSFKIQGRYTLLFDAEMIDQGTNEYADSDGEDDENIVVFQASVMPQQRIFLDSYEYEIPKKSSKNYIWILFVCIGVFVLIAIILGIRFLKYKKKALQIQNSQYSGRNNQAQDELNSQR